MNERCNKCGKELFAGQQFCRQCGAPTRQFSSGEIPTQILPGAQVPPAPQASAPPHAGTTPLGARGTDPIYRSRLAEQYQPPSAAPVALPTQTAQLQRKRSRRVWIVPALLTLLLLAGGSFFAMQMVVNAVRRSVARKTARAVPSIPAIPAIPAVPAMPDMSTSDDSSLSPLDEAGAKVSDDTTVITKTFALKPDASFSLQQIKGDVTIEGWDQNEAQVTITKEGGDAEDRAGVEIMHASTDKGLTLRTPQDLDTLSRVKYEIKLPRTLRRIEIKSQDSDVKLANLAGGVAINVMRGDLSLTKLTGAVATHTMKGDIKVDLKGTSPAGPQDFNTVKGDITLAVGGANAEVRAETVSGGVSADDGLGVSVEKRVAGSHAAGTVGRGGQSVAAKTVSGSIKIKN